MWRLQATTSVAYRHAAGIGLRILVFLFVLLLVNLARLPSEALAQSPASPPSVTGNYKVFGEDSIIAVAQQRLVFSDKLGNELISHMPIKTKPVMITGVGNSMDQKVATQFEVFLRQNGYHNIRRLDAAEPSSPPRGQISVSEAPKGYYLTIAPSAP